MIKSSQSKILLVTSATLLVSGALYLYNQNRKVPQESEVPEHAQLLINRFKLIEIIDDLKIHLTPYYVHYYNLIQI